MCGCGGRKREIDSNASHDKLNGRIASDRPGSARSEILITAGRIRDILDMARKIV